MRDLRDFLLGPLTALNQADFENFCTSVDGNRITFISISDEQNAGMRLVLDRIEWSLNRTLAKEFAEKIDALTTAIAGHQYLDARGNEVAVEVSIGEYPDMLHPVR